MNRAIASLTPRSIAELEALAGRVLELGGGFVELRIDDSPLELDTLAAWLCRHPQLQWIITCRSRREGGNHPGTAAQRAAAIQTVVEGTEALIDLELTDWEELGAKEKAGVLLSSPGRPAQRKLILSQHDFGGMVPDFPSIMGRMDRFPECAIRKIAYHPEHIVGSFAALDWVHSSGGGCVAIAMGEDGLWTRLLAPKFGALGTYCAIDAGRSTAAGQPLLDELSSVYRWNRIGPATRVYGVVGDPVAQSMGPRLFNHWFEQTGTDAVYIPLLVRSRGDCLRRFLDGCVARPWLEVGGFSVTAPHKRSAMHWCGGGADSMSRSIGAINTIVLTPDGPRAHNTDCYAAIDSLSAALGLGRHQFTGLTIDVLGTGGSGRALLYGLQELGAAVTVYGRSADRTRRLAEEFHAHAAPWESRNQRTSEVVVNCTSVGMSPNISESPLAADGLRGCRLVFDLIYNPPQTELLRLARLVGAATRNGLDVFIRQATMQFRLWTGMTPDSGSGTRIVDDVLRTAPGAFRQRWRRNSPIALIGMRGSGKTTVGRELADRLSGAFVDTDDLVVRKTGRTIAQVFAQEGEAGFRRIESEVLSQVAASSPAVVAVGGGAILDPANVAALRGMAVIVWLRARPEVLWARILADPRSADHRPPLSPTGGEAEIRDLLAKREHLYEAAADFEVLTDDRSPRDVAEIIMALLASPTDC